MLIITFILKKDKNVCKKLKKRLIQTKVSDIIKRVKDVKDKNVRSLQPFTLSIYLWRDIFREEETYGEIKRLSSYVRTDSATNGG